MKVKDLIVELKALDKEAELNVLVISDFGDIKITKNVILTSYTDGSYLINGKYD